MRAVTSLAILLVAPPAFAQLQAALSLDHLHCVKVKDSIAKTKYDASIFTSLRIENGCELKLPAALLCTPAISYDERPTPPNDVVGVPPAGPVLCYKTTCPKPKAPFPRATFVDQFGSHQLEASRSQLLCAPETGLCGDGAISALEECDDGNRADGDGCSAQCQRDGIVEIEPNDGVEQAQTIPQTDAVVVGTVATEQDRDTFRSTPLTATKMRITLNFQRTEPMPPMPPRAAVDLLDAGGRTLATAAGTEAAGPSLTVPTGAAVPIVFRIRSVAGGVVTYRALLQSADSICGDGLLEGDEACDDGNDVAGDGCSPACTFESVDGEPNDTTTNPTIVGSLPATVPASILPAGDVDVFAIDLPRPVTLTVRLLRAGGSLCDPLTLGLVLLGTDGTPLGAVAPELQVGQCPEVSVAAPPGRFYAVATSPSGVAVPDYSLLVIPMP